MIAIAHTVKLEMDAKPRLFHQPWVEQPDAITCGSATYNHA